MKTKEHKKKKKHKPSDEAGETLEGDSNGHSHDRASWAARKVSTVP